MNAELYLKKAVLQLAKGLEEKSIESLNKVLETGGDDQISLIKAHLIFAEYYIMKGDFPQAEEHLSYINNIVCPQWNLNKKGSIYHNIT